MSRPTYPAPWERWAYLVLVVTVMTYVVLRAALIPWVHDESTTIFWYCERGEFLPYRALWDAGNHYLSTGIGVLAYKFWGLSLLGSRVGSLIAFPIYAWAVHRIGMQLQLPGLRFVLWLALLLCPFLLDFFSLFRGYGLGMAFLMVAVDGGLRYSGSRSDRHLVQLLLGLFLADMAVLSLVPIWALIISVLALEQLAEWRRSKRFPLRKAAIWTMLGAIPLLFGLLLAWEMRRRGLLYHGSTEGFIPVTLSSLSHYVLGSGHISIMLFVIITILGATLITAFRPWRSPAVLLTLLLWADIGMRVGMAWILGVNYPEDRAALHMVLMAILLFAFAADTLPPNRMWLQRGFMVLLLALPLRSIINANLDHTLLWPEQSVPTRFLAQIASLQQGYDRPLSIGAYHQLGYALPYASRLYGIPLNSPDVLDFPFAPHDVRIVDDRFMMHATTGYDLLDQAPGNTLHLLVRNEPLNTAPQQWTSFDQDDAGAEFVEIWQGDTLDGTEELFLEVRCTVHSPEAFLDVKLVVSLDRDGEALYYHAIPLAHYQARWNGEEFHGLVRIPSLPADRRVVYFWNEKRVPVELGSGRKRIHQLNE